MSLFLAIAFGGLGLRFGRLGSHGRPAAAAPAGDPPTMQFDDQLNSQLLAVLEDW